MGMNYTNAVESFMDYCDSRTIANEGLGTAMKNAWKWIVEKVKAIKDKIVAFVKRLFGKSVEGDNSADKSVEVITEAERELQKRDATANELNKIASQLDAINSRNKQILKDNKKMADDVDQIKEQLGEVKEEIQEAAGDEGKLNAIRSKVVGLLKRSKYYTDQAKNAAKNNNLNGIADTRGHILWVEKNISNIQSVGDNVGKIMQIAQSGKEDDSLDGVVSDLSSTLEKMNGSLSSHDNKGYDVNHGSVYSKKEVQKILHQIDSLANTASQWKGPVEKMQKEGSKNLSKAMQAVSRYIAMVEKCLGMVCSSIGGGSNH